MVTLHASAKGVFNPRFQFASKCLQTLRGLYTPLLDGTSTAAAPLGRHHERPRPNCCEIRQPVHDTFRLGQGSVIRQTHLSMLRHQPGVEIQQLLIVFAQSLDFFSETRLLRLAARSFGLNNAVLGGQPRNGGGLLGLGTLGRS